MDQIPIEPCNAERDLDDLTRVLHACVHAGASVGFVLPFSLDDAKAFWRAVPRGRIVLVASHGGNVAGTVQLDLDTPPNQPHRAEIKKLLVHPEARRRGIARALMMTAEEYARKANRTLLTLDTFTDSPAETLYRSLGYVAVGVIPGYALLVDSSRVEGTTILYKQL